MAKILLLDADCARAAELTMQLQRRNHRVVAKSPSAIRGDLAEAISDAEIVLVNITADRPTDWDFLRSLCQTAAEIQAGPQILAICDVYRGTAPRLRAEQLGCRFLYG